LLYNGVTLKNLPVRRADEIVYRKTGRFVLKNRIILLTQY